VEEWVALQRALPSLDITYACLGVLLRRAVLHDFARRRRKLTQLRRRHPGLAASFDRIQEDLDDWEASIRDAALLTVLMEELQQTLDRVEARLGARYWILGDRYSLADVVWGVALARFDLIRLGYLWERGRRPNIHAYYNRFKERDCFGRAGVVNRHDPGLVVPAVLRAARVPLAGALFAGALGVLLAAIA
jgi:tetrachloro-p-hydroquinone reductive dehalogenase